MATRSGVAFGGPQLRPGGGRGRTRRDVGTLERSNCIFGREAHKPGCFTAHVGAIDGLVKFGTWALLAEELEERRPIPRRKAFWSMSQRGASSASGSNVGIAIEGLGGRKPNNRGNKSSRTTGSSSGMPFGARWLSMEAGAAVASEAVARWQQPSFSSPAVAVVAAALVLNFHFFIL